MLRFLKTLFTSEDSEPSKRHGAISFALAGQTKAEERLSEERFRLLVESVEEYAIFMLDSAGRVVTWNSGAQRIKGYTAEEIIGQHFSRFYPKEEIAAGKPARVLELAAATGKYEEEGWRVRKDGSRFWASVVITALRDEKGTLRGFAKVTRDMTERKISDERARQLLQEEASRRAAETSRAEAERAQREERKQREELHVTLSSIGDGVIVTDVGGLVTFLNPVAQSLTGWTPEDAAGQPLDRVFHIVNEQTRRLAENPATRALNEGLVVGLANHTVLIARDGREFPIDDSAAPIRGEDGKVGGVVLVFRDVSAARRALQERLYLAAIVESSDDAIISKDLNGIITSWNKGAERLYGYTAQEIVGRPLATLVPADHPNELPALMERLRQGERVEHFETVRLCKDGRRLHVSLTISPIRDPEGNIIGASKIARDITARKRSERSLQFLADASKLLAEVDDVSSTLRKVASVAVPHFADWCAVDLLDSDGSLKRVAVGHVDPSKVELAHELYRRHPPDRNAPRGLWHVIRTGQPEFAPEISEAALAERLRDPELLAIVRKLGLRSYMAVPLTVRGKSLGVITFIEAESEQRYDSADLHIAEDLAQRAAIAIENARLYSELREADRRKDEFLAMLAHELRNPLAPIRNALHVLKMPEANVQQARDICERQVLHMVRLVDDLLDVSRIMRGRIELRKEPITIASIVTAAVETAQPAIDLQHQRLNVALPSEEIWLVADTTRLAQVIANLLHNAAKFSPHGGQITVSAERDGDDAVVRVRDEGAGIPPGFCRALLDLFVQADSSLERTRGGLGIGLTVVRRLVEMHDGSVSVSSGGVGKGAEFVIRVPCLPDAPGQTGKGGARVAGVAGAPRRVLVVDDNVDAADSLAMVLRRWGHAVHVAHDGPEALRAAEEWPPDVFAVDIGLPGMNGYELVKQFRRSPRFHDALFVAVSGYGQEEDRRRSLSAGFEEHFTKPVDLKALQALLGRKTAEPAQGR